jgi:hypothetical protein
MTEQEWLECADPMRMLEFVQGEASDRQLRLFDIACKRNIRNWLPDERKALDVAERFADGMATEQELKSAQIAAEAAASAVLDLDVADELGYLDTALVDLVDLNPSFNADALRDIIGDPFHPVVINSAWLAWNDRTVPGIAQTIYEERAFDRMPILADALEDAGCNEQALLEHLRGPGPHCRGCWALDLVLGKE